MNTMRLLLRFLSLIALTSGLFAQSHSEGRSAKVTLFSGKHYTGERIVLEVGEQIDDFRFQRFPSGRNANNAVSSIRIEGDAEVTLYEYRDFKGSNLTIRDSVGNLDRIDTGSGSEDWGNNLSSVVVRADPRRRHNDRDRDRDDDRDHGRGNDRDRGRDDWGHDRGRDDRGPNSDYWRHQREVERMVKRVYQDVLGRAPDQRGLELYVGIVEDRGWDESRLRREMEKSPEYRNTVVPQQITELYRDVLGREPDPAGLRFYTNKVVRNNWSMTKVKRALQDSPEYKAKQRGHR